ncbi:hypothetical protein L1987_86595 [Smallanthus sonchifolius]|uniref:Uncharacterized protein n=1 Tax=Smallanthus sonchifolius TaxID=185202 RepID=A0ACB8Y0H6_9ASTR|nr:hypothetical protein L1987_86595 [Smallanthus sonchifolius]
MTGDEFEITCKRFKNWVAKQRLPAAQAACRSFLTSIYLGLCGELVVMDVCLLCSIPQPSLQSHEAHKMLSKIP